LSESFWGACERIEELSLSMRLLSLPLLMDVGV
jgi:hypothetical protein